MQNAQCKMQNCGERSSDYIRRSHNKKRSYIPPRRFAVGGSIKSPLAIYSDTSLSRMKFGYGAATHSYIRVKVIVRKADLLPPSDLRSATSLTEGGKANPPEKAN